MSERKWFDIRAATVHPGENSGVTVIEIYDQIGPSWWGESTTAKDFLAQLNDVSTAEIHVHINSPGGSVFDGIAIHNALKAHSAKVTTFIDGIAASIAAVIALAGHPTYGGGGVSIADNGMFMIHNPWTMVDIYEGMNAEGIRQKASEMQEWADRLDKVGESISRTYEALCSKTKDELDAELGTDTPMTATEAMEWGFATEIFTGMQVAALARDFDFASLGFGARPTWASPQRPAAIVDAIQVEGMPDPSSCPCSSCSAACMRAEDGEPSQGMPSTSSCPCALCGEDCTRATSTSALAGEAPAEGSATTGEAPGDADSAEKLRSQALARLRNRERR